MSLRSRVLYAACVFYRLQLAFWILTTLLWLPDVQITSQRSPNVPLCGHFTSCTLKWRRAKQAHRACTTSIPLGSGRRRGLPLLGAVYLCRGLFVPLKNVEHPLWLFRPSKNCLSTFVPAPQNTGVEGCDYRGSQITRKGFWIYRGENGCSSSMKRADSKANQCSSVVRGGRSHSRKKAGLTRHELGRMVVMCQLPHDSKWPVLAVWAKLLRNREDNAAQYLSRHHCGNARHLAV